MEEKILDKSEIGSLLDELKESYDETVWPWFREHDVPILEYDWHLGTWNSFPDVKVVVNDLRKVLPSTSEILDEPVDS